jgi:hypothetical protein
MTDPTPAIAPRIVDGEPTCSGGECPRWSDCLGRLFDAKDLSAVCNLVCSDGLRRQRDERTAERDEATSKLSEIRERLDMARKCLEDGAHWRNEQAENQAMRHIDAALYLYETPEGGEG